MGPLPHKCHRDGRKPKAAVRSARIRIVLVDDHAVVRRGVAELLRGEPDMEIVGETADARDAIELAHEIQPDVVLMDVNMPAMNGIEATRRIHRDLPKVRIIGLSMFEAQEQSAAMRQAGAVAYCAKSAAPASLIATIRDSLAKAKRRG